MADEKRFVKIHEQGFWGRSMEIWVDKSTGVNYLITQNGYSGGMTVLVDREGKPIVTPVPEE